MKDLQAGDRSLAAYYQPSFRLAVASSDKAGSQLIEQANRFFAGHPGLLADIANGMKHREREITDDFAPRPALADGQGNLLLVYFGQYQSPLIMAGVKVLFLFDKNGDLAKIFVYEVPLE